MEEEQQPTSVGGVDVRDEIGRCCRRMIRALHEDVRTDTRKPIHIGTLVRDLTTWEETRPAIVMESTLPRGQRVWAEVKFCPFCGARQPGWPEKPANDALVAVRP